MNDELIERLADAFAAHGHQLYLVGGSIRDRLLGRGAHDWDFASDARPDAIMAIARATRPTALATMGEKFGTLHLVYGPDEVEITTYRPRADDDPAVRFGASIADDLARRDFTINAIAQDPRTGALVDPYGGTDDLRAGIIRAVGIPDDRFAEDPLRLLRAVRFAVQFGFRIEEGTYAVLLERAQSLGSIAPERIRDEFAKIIMVRDPTEVVRGIEMLYATGLMAQMLPEVVALVGVEQPPWHRLDVYEHTLAVLRLTAPRPRLRLAALLHDIAKPATKTTEETANGTVAHFYRHEEVGAEMTRGILRRLRFGGDVVDDVTRLVAMHMRANSYTSRWSDGSVRRLFVAAADTLDDLLDLAIADGISDRDEPAEEVRARIESLRERIEHLKAQTVEQPLASPLGGAELMAIFGRPPGPWIGQVKAHLADLVIDGKLSSADKDGARQAAEAFLAGQDLSPRPPLKGRELVTRDE